MGCRPQPPIAGRLIGGLLAMAVSRKVGINDLIGAEREAAGRSFLARTPRIAFNAH
jgi:hypothetical protein